VGCFLGFYLGAASVHDIRGILPGSSLIVITVRRQKVDHVAKFVEKSEDLGTE
jgi:hypothetical protein